MGSQHSQILKILKIFSIQYGNHEDKIDTNCLKMLMQLHIEISLIPVVFADIQVWSACRTITISVLISAIEIAWWGLCVFIMTLLFKSQSCSTALNLIRTKNIRCNNFAWISVTTPATIIIFGFIVGAIHLHTVAHTIVRPIMK